MKKGTALSFAGDRRGTIAIIFALIAFVLFCVVGLAIDFGRAVTVKNKLQRAADAAVMADLSTLGKKDHELRRQVRARLHANLPKALRQIPFELVVSDNGASMALTMKTKVKTSLMAIAGFDHLPVKVKANASIARRRRAGPPASAISLHEALRLPRADTAGGGGGLDGIDLSRLRSGDVRAAQDLAREITRQLEAAEADGRLEGIELPAHIFGRR